MKSLILTLLAVCTFQFTSSAQLATLKEQAQKYVDAVVADDYDALLKFVHPNIMNLGGGPDLVKEQLVQDTKNVSSQGIEYLSGTVGEPTDIINSKGELHSIIPQEIIMNFQGKKFKTFTNLLAASLDNGKSWSFVNLEYYDKESLSIFVPRFDPEMIIPETQISESID